MKKSFRYSLVGAGLVVLLLLSLTAASAMIAAPVQEGVSLKGDLPRLILTAEHLEGGSALRILPPAGLMPDTPQAATIHVTYQGTWDPQAQAAFEHAANIWESLISSPVVIEVQAEWITMPSTTLGGAWAEGVWRDFPGATRSGSWYPNALANKLRGLDLDPLSHDINARFNSSFPDWYFGVNGSPPVNKYDFVSVVLHELCHGLGFFDSFGVFGSSGYWGISDDGVPYPVIYDRYVVNSSGQLLTGFPNPSTALAAQLQSNNVFFNGPAAVSANGGANAELFAPTTFQDGSSIAHLGEGFNGSVNALMTFSLINGEAVHYPGPVTLGIFQDIGWMASSSPTITPTPTQTPKPVFTPSAFLKIPLLLKNWPLYNYTGKVTLNNAPVSGLPLSLRLHTNNSATVIATVTTNAAGIYSFDKVKPLQPGQEYSVAYRNDATVPGRLWMWSTRRIKANPVERTVRIGDFDIADIALVSPRDGAVVSLPHTFQWTRRPATKSDSYELDLYDPDDFNPAWWTEPSLGYVDNYLLNKLPVDPGNGNPFLKNTPYYWEVWVYSPDGGYGISLNAYAVSFSSASNLPGDSGQVDPPEVQLHLDGRRVDPR